MRNNVKSFKLGDAHISIINIGNINLPLAQYMNVPEKDLTTRADLRGLKDQIHVPIHCIHIQFPYTSVLVDAGLYDVDTEPEYAIPDYTPPLSLVEQLLELGVNPATIEHVIITHRHWDHFNGTTIEKNGQNIPQFPNAKYYLGRADWESAENALQDPQSIESRTLKILHDKGILELIDDRREIVAGIEAIHAPGETRGHQIVRVHSNSNTLYCLGDLYHHPIEFANPEWKVNWANSETIAVSRQMLTQQAIKEKALLVATHIEAIGYFQSTDEGMIWESITPPNS